MDLFVQTSELIRSHNSVEPRQSFYLGHTQFSDMSRYEKAAFFGSRVLSPLPQEENYTPLEDNFENSKDWRAEGAVGPIRNEYAPLICQACWAFAVTATLEAAHFIQSGELLEFSPQQLVDCDSGSLGCKGGYVETAIDYVKTNAIMLEKDYPYVALDEDCRSDAAKSTGINVIERFNVQPNDVH